MTDVNIKIWDVIRVVPNKIGAFPYGFLPWSIGRVEKVFCDSLEVTIAGKTMVLPNENAERVGGPSDTIHYSGECADNGLWGTRLG